MSISHRKLIKLAPGSHTPQSTVPQVWPHWAVTSHHHTRPRDAFINHVPSQLGGSMAHAGSPLEATSSITPEACDCSAMYTVITMCQAAT